MINKLIFLFSIIKLILSIDQDKIDAVNNVLKWAKKHEITVVPVITLNPVNENHNLPYFTANDDIPENKTIISIPERMIINHESISNLYVNNTKSKYHNLWDKIFKLENQYLRYVSTKQLFYMTTMIEHSMRIKKGKLYHKYKPYFNLYEYTNLNNFPIFYSQEELDLIKGSNFYDEIKRAKESLESEQKVLYDDFGFTNVDLENFLKYRVLILANSVLHDNNTILIPFLDLFSKDMYDDLTHVEYKYNKAFKKFNIIAKKEIKKGTEIKLKTKTIPNLSSLLYYGYTSERNTYMGRFLIETVNNVFRRRLNWDGSIKLINVSYDLGSNSFSEDIIGTYQNLKSQLKDYKDNEVGEYLLMKENLEDYLKIYDKFTDGIFSQVFYGQKKINNVKRILKLEKKLLKFRIQYLERLIKQKKNNKNSDL